MFGGPEENNNKSELKKMRGQLLRISRDWIDPARPSSVGLLHVDVWTRESDYISRLDYICETAEPLS